MNFIDHYREAQAKDEEIAALKAELVAFKEKLMDFAAGCDFYCSSVLGQLREVRESQAKAIMQLTRENNCVRGLLQIAEANLMAKQANPDGGTTVAPADYLSRALSSRDIPDAYGRA